MIEYLSEQQGPHLHHSLLAATGGAAGLRDRGMLQSALARPRRVLCRPGLSTSLWRKKRQHLMHSLVSNHAFVDGNKRVAIAATELFPARQWPPTRG